MTEPVLEYIGDPPSPHLIQRNFEAISAQWPGLAPLESPTFTGTVTAPLASIGLEARQPVTFAPNWSNWGAGYTECCYWKDAHGIVHLEGLATKSSATSAAGDLIFTLPVGYRPSGHKMFAVGGAAGTVSTAVPVYIDTAGTVKVYVALATVNWVSVEGITFRT